MSEKGYSECFLACRVSLCSIPLFNSWWFDLVGSLRLSLTSRCVISSQWSMALPSSILAIYGATADYEQPHAEVIQYWTPSVTFTIYKMVLCCKRMSLVVSREGKQKRTCHDIQVFIFNNFNNKSKSFARYTAKALKDERHACDKKFRRIDYAIFKFMLKGHPIMGDVVSILVQDIHQIVVTVELSCMNVMLG